MQPEQPAPNYDFIMNPATQPKRPGFGGGSLAMRLLMIVGGVFLLIVIAVIGMKLLAGGSGVDKGAMLSIAQDQTEIIRLSTLGTRESSSEANRNFSITAQLGVTSEQRKLLTYLADNGYKPKAKALVLKQDTKADAQLNEAKSSSTFDTAYKSIMQQKLAVYQRDLKAAYKGAGANGKKLLSEEYDAAALLLTQLNGDTQ